MSLISVIPGILLKQTPLFLIFGNFIISPQHLNLAGKFIWNYVVREENAREQKYQISIIFQLAGT